MRIVDGKELLKLKDAVLFHEVVPGDPFDSELFTCLDGKYIGLTGHDLLDQSDLDGLDNKLPAMLADPSASFPADLEGDCDIDPFNPENKFVVYDVADVDAIIMHLVEVRQRMKAHSIKPIDGACAEPQQREASERFFHTPTVSYGDHDEK